MISPILIFIFKPPYINELSANKLIIIIVSNIYNGGISNIFFIKFKQQLNTNFYKPIIDYYVYKINLNFHKFIVRNISLVHLILLKRHITVSIIYIYIYNNHNIYIVFLPY